LKKLHHGEEAQRRIPLSFRRGVRGEVDNFYENKTYRLNMKKYFVFVASFTLVSFFFFSCQKKGSLEVQAIPKSGGNVVIQFSHGDNGKQARFDTMIYKTSAGNEYMINDLQYFISGIQLHFTKGKWIQIGTDKGIHYVDARDSSTLVWKLADVIPTGTYDSVSFIFGLDADNNTSFRFPDPPQRDMFWPEILGGGYHYMKMNLKWKNNEMTDPMPFMFHLGIGQMYKGYSVNTDSIIGYIQNYFTVITAAPFSVVENNITNISIGMNIEKWFDPENAFDFAEYPMGIMQSQVGMYEACMNGRKAFVVK
jgi:hypothetical protein